MGGAMAGHRRLQADSRLQQRPTPLCAARWAALCQRRHPYRTRGQQDPERHGGQVPQHGRLRCPLCSGLGLPRHADRNPDRKEVRSWSGTARRAGQIARLCHRTDRAPEKRFSQARCAGRMGQPLHDDGAEQRGQRAAGAGQDPRIWLRIPRPQTGQLVLRLRLGAGRGGSRVPGQDRSGGRRGFCLHRPRAACPRLRTGGAA